MAHTLRLCFKGNGFGGGDQTSNGEIMGKIYAAYFSATGTTKKIVTGIANALSGGAKAAAVVLYGNRNYDDAGYEYHKSELEAMYERRAEPELFL